MKLEYKNNKLKKSLTTDKGLNKSYGQLSKKLKQRITQLESADNLLAISKIPVLRLHQYQGGEAGTWSIDIKDNWRLLFEIREDPIPTLEDGGVDLEQVTVIGIKEISDPH